MSEEEDDTDAIRRTPELVSFEEIAVLARIQQGHRDADAGRVVPHDDVKTRLISSG